MDNLTKHKIIFTGGHHNSALAVAKELLKDNYAEVVWFGHKFSMQNDKNPSAEFLEVTNNHIRFRVLHAGKIYKTYSILSWLKIPWGFIEAFYFLLVENPDLIVSFGGYLAAPVVIAAWLQGIPIITHEQTTVVGFANKIIAYFADKILVTWPQSKKYFDSQKVVITGLPLREEIFKSTNIKLFNNNLPVVYITGGKQGSHLINETVGKVLPDLLKKINIIHQTGSNSVYDDFNKLIELREKLESSIRERYLVKQYYFEDEIGDIFNQADIVISRAGAHTTYELAALGKPALFIPIKWASHNEQYKNARELINVGIASMIPENRLTPESLVVELNNMLNNLSQYLKNADLVKQKVIFNAKERIVNEIKTTLNTSN